jgi:hypothetical protein
MEEKDVQIGKLIVFSESLSPEKGIGLICGLRVSVSPPYDKKNARVVGVLWCTGPYAGQCLWYEMHTMLNWFSPVVQEERAVEILSVKRKRKASGHFLP